VKWIHSLNGVLRKDWYEIKLRKRADQSLKTKECNRDLEIENGENHVHVAMRFDLRMQG